MTATISDFPNGRLAGPNCEIIYRAPDIRRVPTIETRMVLGFIGGGLMIGGILLPLFTGSEALQATGTDGEMALAGVLFLIVGMLTCLFAGLRCYVGYWFCAFMGFVLLHLLVLETMQVIPRRLPGGSTFGHPFDSHLAWLGLLGVFAAAVIDAYRDRQAAYR